MTISPDQRKRGEGAELRPCEPAAFAPDIAMYCLLCELFATEGGVELGYRANGFLEGISAALASCVGAEAAYHTLQRHADLAAARIASGVIRE